MYRLKRYNNIINLGVYKVWIFQKNTSGSQNSYLNNKHLFIMENINIIKQVTFSKKKINL